MTWSLCMNAVQQAHPDWLVFYNVRTGLRSAYHQALPCRDTSLVWAVSIEELDRKLTVQDRYRAKTRPRTSGAAGHPRRDTAR